MKATIGFGIIGCGNIGPFHADAIGQLPNAALIAVCDTDEGRRQNFADKYGCACYADHRALLARNDVDIVNVCLPSGLHERMAVDAATAGKHVIVEKPLDVTLEKCDRIICACRDHGVKLSVILPSRFSPSHVALKQAVDAGRFGRLLMGDAAIKWYRPESYYTSGGWRGTWAMDGGGALMNQGIHTIDLLQWIMGPVRSVFAYADALARRIEVEDTAVAVLRFASGAMGIIEAATSIFPGMDARLGIHGEKGSVIVEAGEIKAWDFKDKLPEDEARVSGGPGGPSGGAQDPVKFLNPEGHRLQIQDMIRAVRNDEAPFIDGTEGRKAVEVILAIYRSVQERREVNLPL